MGITSTFARLAELPADQQVGFALAALGEPDDALQSAAVRLLADPAGLARLDLLVDHYAALAPAARALAAQRRDELLRLAREKIVGGRDPHRDSAYELVADCGGLAGVELLALGVQDPSERVRDVALGGLERQLRAFQTLYRPGAHGEGTAAPGGGDPRHLAAREALRTAVRTFPAHRRTVFFDILVGLGSSGLAIVNGVVLTGREAELAAELAAAVRRATGLPAVELLFHMAINKSPAAQGFAHEVLRERRDPAFGAALANFVAAVPGDSALVEAVRELPWPAAVGPALGHLDRQLATRLIELVAGSRRDPARRQQHLETFLGHPDAEVVCRALHALAATRCPSGFAAIEPLLVGASDRIQQAAVELVRALDPPDKAELLAPLLAAPSADLRRLAQREVSASSFQRLLDRFDGMAVRDREAAARSLAKIDPRLLDRLEDQIGSLDATRRKKALQIVQFVNAERDLRAPLMALLGDPDPHVRATALRIVQLTGSAEGVRVLCAALGDRDLRVRANAIQAFGELGDPAHAPRLVPFLRDPHNRSRANAAKVLWRFGHPDARTTLATMLAAADRRTRLSAVWALGELRTAAAHELLERHVAGERDGHVRERVLAALARPAAPRGALA